MTASTTITVTAGSGGIAVGFLTITLTGLNPPNTGNVGDSLALITSISSQTITPGDIEADYTSHSSTCTIAAAGTTGTTTINSAIAYPNSPGVVADFYIDFTVDKFMPAGSSVDITLDSVIGSLFFGFSGSQADYCWATEEYSACTVSTGTVTMTFAKDISASTSIEVYFDDAVTLSTTSGIKP